MDLLKQLNKEQQQAVKVTEGPVLIVAGPGTGKTKTLTARIAYLLQAGHARPNEILALTFTKKAAEEMRERVRTLVSNSDMPTIATFHALCRRLLPNSANVRFIDDYERTMIVKQLRKAADFKGSTIRELVLEISQVKNIPPHSSAVDLPTRQLVDAYSHELKSRNLYDFDDLLLEAYKHLKQTNSSLPYRYILVDEFQDTNLLQYELLRLLDRSGNICVIGDPLQSIYGFRGAGGDMFGRFEAEFPLAHKVTLTTNYRSTPQVVGLANMLFKSAPLLTAANRGDGRVQAVEVLNEYSEAAWIVDAIERAIGGSSFLRSHQLQHDDRQLRTFRDFAILYRTHHVGKVIQRQLDESGIPFQVAGDDSPYEQPNVWAILEIMACLVRPGKERERALGSLPALKKFSQLQIEIILDTLRTQSSLKVSQLARIVAHEFWLTSIATDWLSGTLVRFDTLGAEAFLTYIDTLDTDQFYDPSADAVSLMTIHAAKGLEFNHVFLIATEEDILPHRRPKSETNIDEEKRLFYVAVTRAKDQLDILYAKSRAGKKAVPSRFIEELDKEVLPRRQDSAMARDERRVKKRKAKRSQATLFDF